MRPPSEAQERRTAAAKTAWREAYSRLAALYDRTIADSTELSKALSLAEQATLNYVAGQKDANPRDYLDRWESIMRTMISAANNDRTCSICGLDHAVVVFFADGSRSCSHCLAGELHAIGGS